MNIIKKIDSKKLPFYLVCLLVLIFVWVVPQPQTKNVTLKQIDTENDYPLLDLTEENSVKQSFSLDGTILQSVDFLMVGIENDTSAEICVKIYDSYSTYEVNRIPLKECKNGEFTSLSFNTPIGLKKDQMYTLEISVEGMEKEEEGPRICYYYKASVADVNSLIYEDNKLGGCQLAVVFHYSIENIPDSIKTIQVSITLAVLLIILISFFFGKKWDDFVFFFTSHQKGFFLCVTLCTCVFYLYGFLVHTIPWTEGWGAAYADLMDAGEFPYRDFYYYMPPADLLLTWLLWKISFRNFFLYSCYRLLERLAIIGLMYLLLCKITKPIYAAISSFIGCVILSATVYDLIGDYNQSALLYIEVLCVFLCKYIHLFYFEGKNSKGILFSIGLCIGCGFLLKQTLFISESIFGFAVLTLFFLKNKIPKYIRSFLIAVSGILLPIVICLLVLAYNNALLPFVFQVFLSSGKGSGIGELLVAVVRVSLVWKYIYFVFVFLCCIYLKNREHIAVSNHRRDNLFILFLFLTWIALFYREYVNDFLANILFSKVGFVLLAMFILLAFMEWKNSDRKNFLQNVAIFLSLLIPCFYVYYAPGEAENLYGAVDYFSLISDGVSISFLIVFFVGWTFFYKNSSQRNSYVFAIVTSGAMFSYLHAMGAKDSIPAAGGAFLCAALLAIFLEYLEKNKSRLFLYIICLILPTVGMSQKVVNAYSWWGWSESEITYEKEYEIDLPELRGYRVDYETKDMYERIYKVIQENSDENSTIYGFPYVKIFNVLLNNSNSTWFVPVPFYDVCSDYYAKIDAENLANNPPDIVVWCDIPSCMEVHEALYRSGNLLGQRDIQEWFSQQVAEEEYVLVGQYNNLFVYKRYVKGERLYKDIQDSTAINQTISQ